MALSTSQAMIMIAVVAVCTFTTRVIPFALFGGNREMPVPVKFLGDALPPAIIATLVVYCLKDVQFTQFPTGLAEMLSIAVVTVLHLWKRNTLLSIAGGTFVYMVLIRTIFI